jgi:UDP-N-acetyl-2-amino-2-deoxyglucuronate dehydrogenase
MATTAPSASRLRIAVIGVGMGSAPHFQAIESLADTVDLVWVCARDSRRLVKAVLPALAKRTTRIEDILEDDSVSALLVLTPPSSHLEIVEKAARAGKHVLVEKPLEITLDKAQGLVEVCEENLVKLAVMLQHRMGVAPTALRQIIASGDLGELTSAAASIRWWRPQSYYDSPGRGTLARDGGGVLMTQAIHALDLLLSLTGLPETLHASARTSASHRMECEDTVSAMLHYANGALGNVDATTAAYPGAPERISLSFTGGSAVLEGGELLVQWLDGRTLQAGSRQASGSGASSMAFGHEAHQRVLQDFIDAVRGGHEPEVNGRSALMVHRLIAAMMESSRQGVKRVSIAA